MGGRTGVMVYAYIGPTTKLISTINYLRMAVFDCLVSQNYYFSLSKISTFMELSKVYISVFTHGIYKSIEKHIYNKIL